MLVYPWQWLSAVAGVRLTLRLACEMDLPALQADLERVRSGYRPNTHEGPYHNGRWKRLGLISPDGDPLKSNLTRRGQTYQPTPVLDQMPAVRQLIRDMRFPVRSASISVMEPGARVRWHRDRSHSIDLATVRLHVPVLTHPSSILRVAHETVHWPAGQLCYADFSFPHSVVNGWDQPRIHIIFDLEATDEVRALFPAEYLAGAAVRRPVRQAVMRLFDFSEKFHPNGRRAIRNRATVWAAPKDEAETGMSAGTPEGAETQVGALGR